MTTGSTTLYHMLILNILYFRPGTEILNKFPLIINLYQNAFRLQNKKEIKLEVVSKNIN